MKPIIRCLLQVFALFLWLMPASVAFAQQSRAVLPFAESRYVAEYATEFDQLFILEGNTDSFSERVVEGQRRGTVLIRPEGKSNFEILSSFENALSDAGFSILFSGQVGRGDVSFAIKDLHKNNRANDQPYQNIGTASLSQNNLGRILTFPDYYLSASIVQNGQETVFALYLSRERDHYLMEEITSAAMEQGTVTINEAMLTAQIQEAGAAILHGIQFETGSAEIRPVSAASLAVIANVLHAQSGQFYIVGHTDDTGGLIGNMTLSKNRAAAVISALGRDYGIDTARLEAGGVGPLSPVASNLTNAGKALNRRVELVPRL